MGSSTVVVRIGGPLARDELPSLCELMGALLAASGADLVVCDVRGLERPDAVAVDALARLQLTARQCGCRVRLRHASDELRELMAFIGLEKVVLGVEPSGQAEEREQLAGVEEERELDDPTP
jgi:ABC-type transporter Mla MlaB component